MPGRKPKQRNKYFLRIDNKLVEVSREIYLCWHAGNRKEKYLLEKDREEGLISLDTAIQTDEGYCTLSDFVASTEAGVDKEIYKKELIERLYLALKTLTAEESKLINSLYFEGKSLRTVAKSYGVSHRTISKRRDRILEKLRSLLD